MIQVNYVGFSTTTNGAGEFKIWRKDIEGKTYSDLVKLAIPDGAVAGSEYGEVVVIGDVMGPTLKNLNNLLKLPFGCGEQNMINFAPNVFVLKYLHETSQLTRHVESRAITLLLQVKIPKSK